MSEPHRRRRVRPARTRSSVGLSDGGEGGAGAATAAGTPPLLPPGASRRFWPWLAAGAVAGAVLLAVGGIAVVDPGLLGLAPSSALVLSLSASPSAGYAPFQVFLNVSTHGGVPPYTITWSLDSQVVATGPSAVYYAQAPGAYELTATVTDSHGTAASRSVSVTAVSPLPETLGTIPAAASDLGPTLKILWRSTSLVSSCLLPGFGSVSVPPFSACASAGGLERAGTSDSVAFTTDPDDPEATPVLFQSSSSGVSVSVAWWYNDTAGVENSGSLSLTTAIAPR